ncbi:O-methyltransferase [Actinotalea sp. BY-33]|uniref:O-methyltransferase n=1 Tax=Actinotalea soli TaxID=2819234 RepID=A0A939LP83_9CELL|nr:O-methyltransferase [Actinotalea soli]MBO1750335.1 O-methyltransferase [Actinotalea soli]
MDPTTWAAVDDYLAPLTQEDEVLRAANARAREEGLPPIQVSAPQGRMLQLIAQIHGARRALEIGTLAGYSTIWLARGLSGPQPHLTTLERDPHHAEVARANIDAAGLGDVVEVRVGAAVETLAELEASGTEPFDLVFVDADKPSNTRYLDAALRLVRPGAVIVVDNVVRQGALADVGSTDERVRGSREVVERVASDPRLSATVLQTVGSKGYDGFMLVRVDEDEGPDALSGR